MAYRLRTHTQVEHYDYFNSFGLHGNSSPDFQNGSTSSRRFQYRIISHTQRIFYYGYFILHYSRFFIRSDFRRYGHRLMNDSQIKNLLGKGYSAEHIANYGQCSKLQIDRVIEREKIADMLTDQNRKLDDIAQTLVEQIVDDCDLAESQPGFIPDDYAEQSECPNCDSSNAKTTCGSCDSIWCGDCDPAPSALCHTCHGRGHSTASFQLGIIHWENGSPELDQARSLILEAIDLIATRRNEVQV